jgi:MerR family redox-sensitive transcriptional activator SoxR
VLRRVSVIKVAQRLGVPLAGIRAALESLPQDRAPTAAEWRRLSSKWKADLDERIEQLTQLRDKLGECIGCGCLSIGNCWLRNPWDRLGAKGAGPRLLD